MAKSIRTAIIAAAMTLLLALGAAVTGLTAHAADQPTATEPQVNKTVNVADGITIADKADFSVKQVDNADKVAYPAKVDDYTVSISAASLKANTKVSESLGLAAKTTAVGEYTFEVKETAPADKTGTYGWTVDKTTYYVHVYVAQNGDHSYIVTKGTNTITDNKFENKVDSIDFTNTFTKEAGAFTVTKKVENDQYADKDTLYSFTATFKKSATSGEVSSFINAINVADATDKAVSGNAITFKLKKDQTATFTNVPAGVKVTVEETNRPSNVNSTSITVTSNGKTSALSGDNVKAENVLVGEGTNSVAYTNTYKDVTLTGVATKIAPFIAMVAIAGGAVALYIVSRRRRDA